jgi:hypothetical protein
MRLQESAGNIRPIPKRDRRDGIRFPVNSKLRWTALDGKDSRLAGKGETVDFSSSGLSFRSDVPLSPGRRLELSVDWPTQLEGRVPMEVMATGKVVRADGCFLCVAIDRMEFRTAIRIAGHCDPL